MRGQVIEFNAGGGVIADAYGARYTFQPGASRVPLRVGAAVDFTAANGVASEISLSDVGAATAPTPRYAQPARASSGRGAYDFAYAMFSFEGRLRRSHYWITWAILLGASIFAAFIPLAPLAMLWPTLAKDVKRFHDMGRTGWWAAAPVGVTLLGVIVFVVMMVSTMAANPDYDATRDPDVSMAMGFGIFAIVLVIMLVQLGFWLWMGIADSQSGRNRFGPNPKQPFDDAAEAFS